MGAGTELAATVEAVARIQNGLKELTAAVEELRGRVEAIEGRVPATMKPERR